MCYVSLTQKTLPGRLGPGRVIIVGYVFLNDRPIGSEQIEKFHGTGRPCARPR